MNFFTKPDLQALLEAPKWAASIYLPTHRVGRQTGQNPIRFKNLLQQAGDTLKARGIRDQEMQESLEIAQALLQDSLFWQQQSDGLAVFIAPETLFYYRLPLDFDELIVVGERFHLKPLLPLFSGDGQFYVLALSQNEVRLLQGSRHSIDTVDLESIPASKEVALRFDDPEKQLQYHTGTTSRRGRRPAIFHGHGVGGDQAQQKIDIQRFLYQVDTGLQDILGPEISLSQGAPLVLAGVDYLQDIYRQVNSYPHIIEGGIPGNPEEKSAEELHRQAWSLVEPCFQQAQQKARDEYWERSDTPLTSTAVPEVVLAAHDGRVETLFVALGRQQWGRFDSQSRQLIQHQRKRAGDEDLLDYVAMQTLLQGGVVYAVDPQEVPGGQDLAAVFRYSTPAETPV